MKKIFSNINQYFLLSQAGLRHDMAKRIMYSVIPSLMDRRQLHANLFFHGVEDPSTIDLAIEGWKDIVKYGTEACVRELRHSPRGSSSVSYSLRESSTEFVDVVGQRFLEEENYNSALDLCIEDFSKSDWQNLFGGEPWRKIASQLKEILTIGNQIKADPKNTKLKSQMIIALNVFDGLAHNTNSIMKNLTKIESENLGHDYYDYDDPKSEEEFQRILQLMDAKELKNGIDVYQEIEPELEAIEPFYFRDWKTKARSHPGHRRNMKMEDAIADRQKVTTEKTFIRIKKTLLPKIDRFNINKNNIQKSIKDLKNIDLTSADPKIKSDFSRILNNCTRYLSIISGELASIVSSLKTKFKKLSISKMHLHRIIKDNNITLKLTRLRHEPIKRFG